MKKVLLRKSWGVVSLGAVGLGAALLLGGCGNDGSTPLQSLRENRVLQNAARALLTGQVYDRAAIAIRNNDEAALETAQKELQVVAPRLASKQAVQAFERVVEEALKINIRAEYETDKKRAAQLRAQAATKYRQALKIDPEFQSNNPDLLNALGYFLAERGQSPSDFQKAEKLTRRSLELSDEIIKNTENSRVGNWTDLVTDQKFGRAVGPQDSLAWALFRQKKYSEALKEQTEAVAVMEKLAGAPNRNPSADLYYHLGEIHRALKNFDTARDQFQKALNTEPDHELSLRALKALPTSPRTKPPAPEILPELPPGTEPVPAVPEPETLTA